MNYSTQHRFDKTPGYTATKTRRRSLRGPLLLVAGAALATAAVAVRQRTRQAEWDNPPVGQFIEVEGVRLHYVERGQGQPLVFLHGDGSMIQDFALSGLIDLAAKNYHVIVFDRPGYGYSDRPRNKVWNPQQQAELLHHALLKMQVERPIIVGHSWGTLVAVSMGLEFPSYIKSLVLLSGYYYPSARLDVPLLSPPAIPIIGDLMRYTISPLIGRLVWPAMVRRIFYPASVPQSFSRYPVWMTLRPSQLRATAAETALMIPAALSLRHRYHELSMPVVIMAGKDDKHVSTRWQSERLHEDIPQSELHLTSGAGHMIHHLVPHEVMAAIDSATRQADSKPPVPAQHIYPASTQIN